MPDSNRWLPTRQAGTLAAELVPRGIGQSLRANPGGSCDPPESFFCAHHLLKRMYHSTRSAWAAMTASISLHAPGISSIIPASLWHSTPCLHQQIVRRELPLACVTRHLAAPTMTARTFLDTRRPRSGNGIQLIRASQNQKEKLETHKARSDPRPCAGLLSRLTERGPYRSRVV
jgi:hypothetical protein